MLPLLLLLAWSRLASTAPDPANVHVGPGSGTTTPRDEVHLRMVLATIQIANDFRLLAAAQLQPALDRFASSAMREQWEREIAPFFKGDEDQWNEFFSNAVIMSGRLTPARAVVIFYNVWSDVALVCGVDLAQRKITEFFVLGGERFRGEDYHEKSGLPAWMRLDASLAHAIARAYSPTEKAIAALYPLEAPYELLPAGLKRRLVTQKEELLPVKIRMHERVGALVRFVADKTDPEAQALLPLLLKLLQSLKKGDVAAFARLVSPAQDRQLQADIFNLPAELRTRMGPCFYFQRPAGAVCALSSPTAPGWFLTVHFTRSAPAQYRLDRVELYNLNLIYLLLKK